MPINSKEIAAHAGVSQATVSRVLNNKPNVREKTRKRVLRAIEELGYYPNAEARSLVTRRTTKLGLVVSDILNPFYPEFIETVEALARRQGFNVLLCNTQRDPQNDEVYARLLIEQRVAGTIFSSITPLSNAPSQLSQAGIPFVFVNRYLKDTSANIVITDNFQGAYKMTEYLLQLGHVRIAFIRGLSNVTTSQDREAGYRRCLQDHGLEAEIVVEQGDYTREGAYEATTRLLQRFPAAPSAIFCANDYMAFGALDAIYQHNLRVPEDISVVGFDNIALSALQAIGLTTIEQPIGKMACKAMEILLSRIEAGNSSDFQTVVYKPKLIVRRTSGPPHQLSNKIVTP
ncbi:MAG TPA: LacI family transcriptional regulator [Chloroflexi bacterium]|nr:LacI family transcriptional regulator [Chloroflexota bacterium]